MPRAGLGGEDRPGYHNITLISKNLEGLRGKHVLKFPLFLIGFRLYWGKVSDKGILYNSQQFARLLKKLSQKT